MFYPEINEKSIRLILQMMKDHPRYLFMPDCPYAEDIKNTFMLLDTRPTRELNDQEFEAKHSQKLTSASLVDELNELYSELKGMLNQEMPEKEKQQWIKTSTAILEKLLGLMKEAAEVAKVEAFMEEVETILTDCVTIDQRAEIIDRIQKAAGRN